MPMDIIEQKDKPAMTPLSADDLLLLVDLFYLPYNHGQKAKQIIADFKWLKFNAIKEDSEEFMELTEQEQKTKVWSPVLHFQNKYPGQSGLSESFEVDGWVVKVGSQTRDILFKKHHP